MLTFQKNLALLRKQKKISQEKFGAIFGYKKNAVSQWETGKRNPDLDTVVKIANYFDVTVDFLIGGNDKRAPTQWQNTDYLVGNDELHDDSPPKENEIEGQTLNLDNGGNIAISKIIYTRRKELGLSVDDLANKIGKSRATIYRYENGDIEDMPASIIESLSKALQITPLRLLGIEAPQESCNTEIGNATATQKKLINKLLTCSDLICDTVSTYLDGVLAGTSLFDKN